MTGRTDQIRDPREVLEDHLRLRREGNLEEDLRRNYAEEVILLTRDGVLRGHDGVRRSVELLCKRCPGNDYNYRELLIEEGMGFLEWSGQMENRRIEGADSYLIRDGRIAIQTIHYQIESVTGSPSPEPRESEPDATSESPPAHRS